jgi:hypothetical protein
MRTRIGLITFVMSGLWVWASVLDAQPHNDDGFDRVPLVMEMRDAARQEASAREGALRLASTELSDHTAAAN